MPLAASLLPDTGLVQRPYIDMRLTLLPLMVAANHWNLGKAGGTLKTLADCLERVHGEAIAMTK